MKKINAFALSITITLLVSACSSTSDERVTVQPSYLSSDKPLSSIAQVDNGELLNPFQQLTPDEQHEFRFIPPFKLSQDQRNSATDILSRFSEEQTIQMAADALPLNDFLHQVFGSQLAISYILSDDINDDVKPVTLNLTDKISPKKLFTLTEELLTQRDYIIRFDDNIFYVHKDTAKSGKGDVVYGFGKSAADIPQTSLEIIQMVPFEYGMQISIGTTLRQLLGVKAVPDQMRNSITVQGKRKDIERALEFIRLMDTPAMKDRHIGMYKSAFLPTSEISSKLEELLGQEGISVGNSKITNLALSIVELDKQGELVFFANNQTIIERAVFWAKQIDKPVLTAEKQYFIYQPMYSRALDMGESLEALIGNSSGSLSNQTSADGESSNNNRRGVRSASSKSMKMVVDERANSLIFFTSGAEYQQLLPLIKRLDVLPKQVVLEVIIAEVKLTDKFKSGVEMILTNRGAQKTGGFNIENNDKGLTYVLSGIQGSLTVNLLQTNANVNVLSRPSVLVRDGVSANITVGDDIPTVGATVTDPNNGTTTSVVYRKTGVDLQVTPTINARGVIIMEIKQKISSQQEVDNSVAGSPIVFERNISTEVIAESGQTIVLGGLISENSSYGKTSVPFFSSIPLIGNLFNGRNDSTDKTELVVLVTPKVIESSDEWDEIKGKFSNVLQRLAIK